MVKEGNSYLVLREKPAELFRELPGMIGRSPVLLVGRDNPKKALAALRPLKVKNLWVTNIETKLPHVKPQEMEQLCYDIEKFMNENKGCAVILTATNYLITYTCFSDVLHMIQTLRDLASVNMTSVIVYVGCNTLDEKEENLLKQDLEMIGEANEDN